MSTGFTKLFGSILDSSVWEEEDRTRLVWIALMAMADRDGVVHASLPGLARRARVPREDTEAALEKFLAPDPDSRTPDHEGRRIEVVRGGWRLLNHAEYRRRQSDEDRREKAADRQRRKREREKKSRQESRPVTESHSGHDIAETEADLRVGSPAAPPASGDLGSVASPPEPLILTAIVDPLSPAVSEHQATIALFDELFRAASGGAKPSWGAKQGKQIRALLKRHGAAEVQTRIRRLFSGALEWPAPPYDLGTLVAHFDKLVEVATSNPRALTPQEIFDRARLEDAHG